MVQGKTNLLILCGGKSREHEVSLVSARSVYQALNKDKYNVWIIGIDKDGVWRMDTNESILVNVDDVSSIRVNPDAPEVALIGGSKNAKLVRKSINNSHYTYETIIDGIDVVFPVMHGTYGEDGSIQGYLELLDIPYVGPGVLGSAIGMDKDVTKRLLRHAGINVVNFRTLRKGDYTIDTLRQYSTELSFPIFVKPSCQGSSVGVSKAKSFEELMQAVEHAFNFDSKVLLEEYIPGRELKVSVLGYNTDPKVSVVGEVKPNHEFYSYDAKYVDPNGAELLIPADIPTDVAGDIQKIAKHAFKILECTGMCRIDFFYSEDGLIYLNEINTIPGFTKSSMYSKLWEYSGLSFSELLDKLINLALVRK